MPGMAKPTMFDDMPMKRPHRFFLIAGRKDFALRNFASKFVAIVFRHVGRSSSSIERVWLSCWTNRHEYAKTDCQGFDLMAGGVMPKMVIEVPEEFTEVGKAMAEHLAALQRTVSRLGGGKAVDYAEIEQAMAESAGRTELAGHRAILQSLDIDVPAVIIGGVRYTRVGRCEAPYHTMVGSVSVERSLYRQSGERGGQPGGRVVDPVSLRAGVVEDGWLPRAARAMAHAVQQGPSRA